MMKVRQTSVNRIVFVWTAACVVLGLVWVFLLFRIYIIKTTPVISVVMSTYNRSDLLPRAIESILNQTYKDFEFIIINDGSTDGTSDVLKSYAARDKRIRIIENEGNKGLVYSLNRGLDLARGKYIVRMDDDDESLPERFENQFIHMERNPDVVALGTAAYYNKRYGAVIRALDADALAVQAYIQAPFLHPSAMIRRSFLDRNKLRYSTDYPSAEDTFLWYQMVHLGGKIDMLNRPLLVYNTKSSKFKGYYSEQARSYRAFLKTSVGQFVDVDYLRYPPHVFQRCYIERELLKAADLSSLKIDRDALDRDFKKRCSGFPEIVYKVRYRRPDLLTGYQGGNELCRRNTDNCAEILFQDTSRMTLRWSDGVMEDLVYQPDTREYVPDTASDRLQNMRK